MQLKSQFQSVKESLSVSPFFYKLKDMASSLIFDDDFILQLLNGFSLEYDDVVAIINFCDHIELEEFQSRLLNQETRIQQANHEVIHVAKTAQKDGRKYDFNNSGGRNSNGNNREGFNSCGRGRGSGHNPKTNST